jgi:translation initiation factor IF-3
MIASGSTSASRAEIRVIDDNGEQLGIMPPPQR